MSDISYNQYWEEIREIAKLVSKEALESCEWDKDAALDEINDYRLHEWIDGHHWVIYNYYNLQVMNHSDNEEYYIDNFGIEDAGHTLKDRGLSGLHQAIAYWCMYADVQNLLDEKLDELIAAHDDEDEQ